MLEGGKTIRETAQTLDITVERARRLKMRAVRRLKYVERSAP